MHAAVEQDAHEGDGDYPFHRLLRRRVQGGDDLDRDGRAGQDQRGRRDLDPFCQPVRQHRDQPCRSRQHDYQGVL